MAQVIISDSYLTDIANAIRSKTGTSTTYKPSEMSAGIMSISGGGITPTGTISIIENGTYDVTQYAGASVAVPTSGVQINNQDKTVNPSTFQQQITYDSAQGYTGLGTVTVTAMPTMTLPTSAAASATSGYSSKATISRSTSDQYINIPTGYNSAGAYYKINAVPNGTVTAPATISGTSATVSTGTNTLTLTKTISVTPSVSTAGYISAGTAGNSSVSLTASITTQAAQTIYPSTSDQTINSGRYLTGTQTIKAVTTSNLTAANIKSGVVVTVGDSADADRITSVTGTYEGSGGGSSKNAQTLQQSNTRITATSYTKACGDLTVSKTGTYDVYWTAYRTSTSGTWGTQLYIDSSAYGSAQTTFTSSYYQAIHLSNVSLTANQKIAVYGRSRGSNYYLYVGQLTIIES